MSRTEYSFGGGFGEGKREELAVVGIAGKELGEGERGS